MTALSSIGPGNGSIRPFLTHPAIRDRYVHDPTTCGVAEATTQMGDVRDTGSSVSDAFHLSQGHPSLQTLSRNIHDKKVRTITAAKKQSFLTRQGCLQPKRPKWPRRS